MKGISHVSRSTGACDPVPLWQTTWGHVRHQSLMDSLASPRNTTQPYRSSSHAAQPFDIGATSDKPAISRATGKGRQDPSYRYDGEVKDDVLVCAGERPGYRLETSFTPAGDCSGFRSTTGSE
ncbi:hypothetical protein BaRGS_00017010, partial [Batillaria attramentaria]